MAEFLAFCEGWVIGICLAAPVGPVGILCIRRTLSQGKFSGFVAGMGAACADTFFGAVAAFSLTLVSHFLTDHIFELRLIGGIFLLLLGFHIYRQPVVFKIEEQKAMGYAKDFVSSFLITLSNPATILAAMGIFAALGAIAHKLYPVPPSPVFVVIGVFFGSAFWWMSLSFGAHAIKNRFSPQWIARLNHASGIGLALFAVFILASLFFF